MKKLILISILYLFFGFTSPVFASFVNDNFTGTDGTDLSSHTSDSGHTWTKRGGSAIVINNNRINSAASDDSNGYYSSATPASADYEVQADFTVGNSANVTPAIGIRMATGAVTGYIVLYGNGTWELHAVVAGVEGAAIGTYTGDQPTTTKTVVLKASGTTISVTIGGVSRISVTDSSISAAGRPGVAEYFSDPDSAKYIDNWSATNIVASVKVRGSVKIRGGIKFR